MGSHAAAGLLALSALAALAAGAGPAPPASEARQVESDCPGRWDEENFPPWQHGANNDALDRGLEFTVPDADVLADFHGDPANPLLVLYVGGNYFFAMAPLVQLFETRHPQYRGRLYWETIPPGLLVRQIEAGGRVTVGNMTWTAKPDVYLAGLEAVKTQIAAGLLEGPAVPYVTNTLTIMVPRNNPAHVAALTDLGRAAIRLAMPDPEFEGVARQIHAALEQAGGAALAQAVYGTKVRDGTTRLTRIHHRQTPLWLLQCRVDAGVTWKSEALFQEETGHAIGHVDIPDSQNATGVYAAATVRGAAHVRAAKEWLDFIRSPQALAVFERYGFKPYVAETH
ncbi:MAG TPA: substrate-binding domain-containing protein [Steroidobacteraceae bacterium]|nr:substrate-binding domain-containing protein [Steroidobacteraceae bacterium]